MTVKYRAVKGEPPKVFDDFSLQIGKGEKIALIGSNGAGKSTMMKLMMGLIRPESGQVLLNGRPTAELPKEELGRTISMVYQNPEEMFIKDSIRKDIEYAMKVRRVEDYEKHTDELLEMFRLTDLQDRDGRLLSGGQMRRASLAIGIALQPEILLLDEPTANLDIATRREIMKTLQMLKGVTDTVVIATHDMQLVCDWAERLIVLSSGYVIADGTKEEIFADMYVRQQVGIRPPQIYDMGRALGIEIPVLRSMNSWDISGVRNMRKLSENILDKISIDFLRNQVLKNAYGNDDTVIAKLDPRILLVWYLFFGLVPWFLNDAGAPAGDLHFRCTDHAGGPDRAAGAFPVLHWCIFSDGISVYRGAVLRREYGDDCAASDHDAESCSCVSCIDHGILGARSGPSGERHALVRVSWAAFFQYFLCVPDPAGADGRVPEYPALLQAAGQSAFKERAGPARSGIWRIRSG